MSMATDDHIVTAAEMERLSPNERAALIQERMVTDDNPNPELVAWARERYQAMLEASP